MYCNASLVYLLAAASGEITVIGDVNADNKFTVADFVMLEKFLLGAGTLTDWQAGDLYNDGKLDVFDMIEMRKEIIKGSSKKTFD